MIEEIILNMEKEALERWARGDPQGCLDISAENVTYFDPFIDKRIDGIDALTKYYDNLRGKIKFDSFELLNPKFILSDDLVILTYNYVSYRGDSQFPWNCTEVYKKIENNWKIVQTHWSITKPDFCINKDEK